MTVSIPESVICFLMEIKYAVANRQCTATINNPEAALNEKAFIYDAKLKLMVFIKMIHLYDSVSFTCAGLLIMTVHRIIGACCC